MIKELLASHIIYLLTVTLFMLGLFGMLDKGNLMKKLMAMNVMQVAVIVFFLLLALKAGGTLPVEIPGLKGAANYINPLPHALMLTAIVVSLSTTGVALALLMLIQRRYGVLEEDEVLRRMNK